MAWCILLLKKTQKNRTICDVKLLFAVHHCKKLFNLSLCFSKHACPHNILFGANINTGKTLYAFQQLLVNWLFCPNWAILKEEHMKSPWTFKRWPLNYVWLKAHWVDEKHPHWLQDLAASGTASSLTILHLHTVSGKGSLPWLPAFQTKIEQVLFAFSKLSTFA